MSSLIELPHSMNRSTKVLLVMDVVESVRLMEQDQDDFVRRWQQLVQLAEQQILPLHGGRIVKSLGDGLMLEFASAQGCAKAAFALQMITQRLMPGCALSSSSAGRCQRCGATGNTTNSARHVSPRHRRMSRAPLEFAYAKQAKRFNPGSRCLALIQHFAWPYGQTAT